MELPKTSTARNAQSGFTLMEMLIVIGIITVLSGVSLFIDINSYRGDAFRAEKDALATALQTARADALNNIDQDRHGVAINPSGFTGYVIFEGDTYATANHTLDARIKSEYGATISSPGEIVFTQLSGDANYDGNIILTDPARNLTSIININHEGRISW